MYDKGTKKKALVIGGSLGGLFAATALRAIGWEVQIYERSAAALDSRGGGIVLQPEVLEAFRFSGVNSSNALGVRSNNRTYLTRTGDIRHKHYSPQTQTSWNTLYSNLISVFPEDNYHKGRELVTLEQKDNGVTAYFADGSMAHGDVLIGADGGSSTVRGLVLPNTHPTYSGYVVWRGLVNEPDLPQFAKEQIYEDFVFQQDAESLILEYMIPGVDGSIKPGERRFNWLWYLKAAEAGELDQLLTDNTGFRRKNSIPPGALGAQSEAAFRKKAEEALNPAFLELVRRTDDIFVQPILDLKTPKMVFNRVLLLGDAAFIPRPHTAGSTAKAATNAITLAQHMANSSDLDKSLAAWERDQLQLGISMSEWGIDMGNRIMSINPKNKEDNK
ncbi:FAD binding domain-containing protein [Pseudomonas helleri]|uniref:FAD binding domain-containing protein n=1 Tax=Pseudomonas helleri TaxID=1608996 RepID=UPI003FD278F6